MSFFKPKVSTVGGGRATGTANQFNDYLTGIMRGGYDPYASSSTQTNMFSGAINDLLSGKGRDISKNPFLNPLQDYDPSVKNMPSAPGLTGPRQVLTPQFKDTAINPYNVNIQGSDTASKMRSMLQPNAATDPSSIAAFMSQFGGGPGNVPKSTFNAAGSSGDFSFAPGKLLNYNTDSPEFQALKQLNDRTTNQDIADMRARFALDGTSLGSGASLAEAQLRAEANPRNILALGQLGRQMQEMDMGQQQINNNSRIGLGGLQVQDQLGRLGIGADLSKFNVGNETDFLTKRMGIGADILRGNQNFNLGQLSEMGKMFGIDAETALKAAIANNEATGMMNKDFFTKSAAENEFNTNMFDINSRNALTESGQANDFNTNIFNTSSNNALNMQQLLNNFAIQKGGIGMDLESLAQGGQQNILSLLFGSMNNANSLGTPQAQIVQKPSGFSQALGFAKDLAPLIAAPFTGGASLGAYGFGGFGGGAGAQGRPAAGNVSMASNPFQMQYNPANFAAAGGGFNPFQRPVTGFGGGGYNPFGPYTGVRGG